MSTMMYDKIQKMTVALLTITMLLVCQCIPALASSVDSVQVRSAPMTAQTYPKDGMVRVYLSSLGNPATLDLTVNGNYSFSHSGEFIASGSSLRVGFSAADGQLTLTYNGQTYQMGKSFSLRRHSASGANGILIAQSRDSQNPYPGDLSFEAVSNGSGYTLYTIAHVYIENYLYGVLPYEMGNSSGLEALKAQAVAARTYTVRMMENRASGRYDVKDTTSDQVYRGTPSGNANCVAAVDATKGIVLMHGSNYITTYYSASNGGQTEIARNGSNAAYMQVKDDPFDYANPSSTVKKKTVCSDLNHSANPAGLVSLLKSKAITRLQNMGYPATYENTSLGTLSSVTPHTPMYASPSRLYTKMDFTFTVSSVNASGQNTLATLTETCDIFTELESLLGMGIQSANNELWSVTKQSNTFVLQARRYGHGMGMSQRGAMYMAKLGYTYDQILGFYFDGCNRVQHSFTNSILSSSTGDQHITVEPPAELDEPVSASCTGTVTLTGNDHLLAIRSAASSDASVIGTAGNGTLVEVLAQSGEWYQIRFGAIVGYVPTSALEVSGTPEQQQQDVTTILGFATVKANDFVNLRASGSMNAQILGTAPTGSVLTVISRSGSWAKVQYQALTAYVNTNYISAISSEYPSANFSTGSSKAVVVTESGTGTVNLRKSASTSAKLVDRLAVGTIVTVLSDDGSWCRISCEAGEGYMLSSFLKYAENTENDENADDMPSSGEEDGETVPEEDNEEEAESSSLYAAVNTQQGSLNMRAQPNAGSCILTTIPQGTQIEVLAKGEEWSAARYSRYDGYVMTRYLAFASEPAQPVLPQPDADASMTAVVSTPSGTLNLREMPNAGSQILKRIPPYTVLNVLEKGMEWSKVTYQGMTGYVMNSFLRFQQSEDSPSQDEELENTQPVEKPSLNGARQTAYVNTRSGSLNLRRQPGVNSNVLTTIPRNTAVLVTAYGNEWCAVRYGAYEGYVMTQYLRFDDLDVTPPAESVPEDETESKPEETKDPYNSDQPYITIGGIVLDVTLEAPASAIYAAAKRETVLYAMCAENSEALTTVPAGEETEVLLIGDLWCRVAYQDVQGYCQTSHLDVRENNE